MHKANKIINITLEKVSKDEKKKIPRFFKSFVYFTNHSLFMGKNLNPLVHLKAPLSYQLLCKGVVVPTMQATG